MQIALPSEDINSLRTEFPLWVVGGCCRHYDLDLNHKSIHRMRLLNWQSVIFLKDGWVPSQRKPLLGNWLTFRSRVSTQILRLVARGGACWPAFPGIKAFTSEENWFIVGFTLQSAFFRRPKLLRTFSTYFWITVSFWNSCCLSQEETRFLLDSERVWNRDAAIDWLRWAVSCEAGLETRLLL